MAFHTLGAVVSAGAFGAALGTVGSLLGAPWGVAGGLLVGGLALLYAARELFDLPIPILDRRRQVPAWWRTAFSPRTAAFLYGLGLGIGFLTYLRFGTLVVVSAVAIGSGDPLAGAVFLATFGLARGLSVAVVWAGVSTDRVQRVAGRLESLAEGSLPAIANVSLLLILGFSTLALPLEGGGETAVDLAPWAISVLFGWAAVAKLARLSSWRTTLRGYGVRRPLGMLALPLVPVAEAAVPVLALLGRIRESATLALILLIIFSGAVIHARRAQGRRLPCGCFGKKKSHDYRALLLRNLALGLLAGAAIAGRPARPVLESLRWPHVGEALPALLVLLGLALGTSAIAQILRLRTGPRSA
ncbi:MAG TPA: MauE/DoxX family redox-associated membrane protein [Actinomycetota bacterium]|nr:MauE/DoxX family redox-associated membrane protein [Actinomycetota bacterium]